jgi:hypothetical protein
MVCEILDGIGQIETSAYRRALEKAMIKLSMELESV